MGFLLLYKLSALKKKRKKNKQANKNEQITRFSTQRNLFFLVVPEYNP